MLYSKRGKFAVVASVAQVALFILFGTLVIYDDHADPIFMSLSHKKDHEVTTLSSNNSTEIKVTTNLINATEATVNDVPNEEEEHNAPTVLDHYYPMFLDVHVMVFIGFGFLFTFLKRYGYSAVGVNMFVAAIAIQWAIMCEGFFLNMHNGYIKISIESILTADVAAASVLIAWGALLGKTSPMQLIALTAIHLPLFSVNEWIILKVFQATDVGASMICHIFGAYFGLTASLMLYRKDHHGSSKEGAIYHSDVFAMIGTIFLWLYWPSFNAALASGDARHRAVLNTYLSLSASCVVTFALSSLLDKHNKFNMVHVQNATLAGGVAVGATCDTMLGPYGALLVGAVAAVICVLGFKFLTPLLAKRLRIHDTCGVNDLHGMIGIYAGIVSVIMASLADETKYGNSLYVQYPAMSPVVGSKEFLDIQADFSQVKPGLGRTAHKQALYQLASIGTSLGISIVGGMIAGAVMRLQFFDPLDRSQVFDDREHWEIPDDDDDVEDPPANSIASKKKPSETTVIVEGLTCV